MKEIGATANVTATEVLPPLFDARMVTAAVEYGAKGDPAIAPVPVLSVRPEGNMPLATAYAVTLPPLWTGASTAVNSPT